MKKAVRRFSGLSVAGLTTSQVLAAPFGVSPGTTVALSLYVTAHGQPRAQVQGAFEAAGVQIVPPQSS